MSSKSPKHVGIALSGGGTRAAVFHLGVLKYLAERNVLEWVQHISSVSGGSLVTGLVFHLSDYCWPTSPRYLSLILPRAKEVLCTTSLQFDAFSRLAFNPLNWRYLLSRAAVLSKSIEHLWGISCGLERLPQMPIWSINATTAENGRRFRFKQAVAGDYELGYADFSGFKLSHALAISAAFPGGIGPFPIDASSFTWTKREGWDLALEPKPIVPAFKKLQLYDGGVYDNLGLEPLFDPGTQSPKRNSQCIIVSDAGAPYRRSTIPGPLHPGRFKRLADVALDQTRSLRVRSFVNYLKLNPRSGQYLQIGSNAIEGLESFAPNFAGSAALLAGSNAWLESAMVARAVRYPTTLRRMDSKDFDNLMLHGYQTAAWNTLAFDALGVLTL
jgi:NTE family protein